jgi:polar amino acid transport system substrate-binding protein
MHTTKRGGFTMKKLVTLFMIMALATLTAKAALAGDTLADAKKKGVLVVGCKDSLPPFGYIDEKSRQIVGYDIDFVNAIAKKMGVKVELKPVTSASRMPQLQEGHIDIIAATMTKNAERAKVIDFSHTYFFTGQKFITKKGTVKSLKNLEGKRIGTAKGSTSEQNVKKAIPSATVLSFDDYPQAFLALQQGKVSAVTTDEAILAGILAKAPNKAQFEIPALQISDEPYGLGMRKGDTNFVNFVNKTILEMEKSGEAAKIFEKWFGPTTQFHLNRTFKITAGK